MASSAQESPNPKINAPYPPGVKIINIMSVEHIRFCMPLPTRYGSLQSIQMNACWKAFSLVVFISLMLAGCVSAPHEIVSLHEKEEQLLKELQRTHLALVDAYVDQRLAAFESFYFSTYGPKFRQKWEKNFNTKTGKDYNPNENFNIFHEDLVAEYLEQKKPIESMRDELKASVKAAYEQIAQSHSAVGEWIRSVEHLNKTQREFANTLLKSVNPSLSLEKVDSVCTGLVNKLEGKMK